METKNLLLIDDDAVFRKYVAQTLASLPLSLREAPNGMEAARCLAAAPPDVILLDGLLPDMDGFQFIERYRALIGDIPVLFISSFWKDFKSFNALTKGLRVAAVLHKPVRSVVLIESVAKAVGGLRIGAVRPARPFMPQALALP